MILQTFIYTVNVTKPEDTIKRETVSEVQTDILNNPPTFPLLTLPKSLPWCSVNAEPTRTLYPYVAIGQCFPRVMHTPLIYKTILGDT